jgi:thiosulfate reductase cytochrome b subunit
VSAGRLTAVRTGRWSRLIWLIPAALAVLVGIVVIARWMRELPAVADWVTRYPGVAPLPEGAPVGTPAWVAITHFLNLFFMVLIIKSGLAVRNTRRPSGHWTRRLPPPRPGRRPTTITLEQWFHVSLDVLWLVNGTIFAVLLLTSGRWVRLVPTSWDVVPNAASAALQYLSLQWPHENGWIAYNALQLLAYFGTVFLLAPAAALTGVRLSALWPKDKPALDRLYPIERARAVHYPVMLLFVVFIVTHVVMVATTGVLRNLNHMFALRDDTSWFGLGVLALAVILVVTAWVAARPVVLRPLAALTGKVTR